MNWKKFFLVSFKSLKETNTQVEKNNESPTTSLKFLIEGKRSAEIALE